MEVVAEFRVSKGVVSGFVRGAGRGVEVLELVGEAHADFEGVCHSCWVLEEEEMSMCSREDWVGRFTCVFARLGPRCGAIPGLCGKYCSFCI